MEKRSPEQVHRATMRAYAGVYHRRGILKAPEVCELCRSRPPTQKHHEGYNEDQPLKVIFLCDPCHNHVTRVDRKPVS